MCKSNCQKYLYKFKQIFEIFSLSLDVVGAKLDR